MTRKAFSPEHAKLLSAALEVRDSLRSMLASGTLPSKVTLGRLADKLTAGLKARQERQRQQS